MSEKPKMADVFELPLKYSWSNDPDYLSFRCNSEQHEAIVRAVNEYDEMRELLGQWENWWDASENFTNSEEMHMPTDPRDRTRKLLGGAS